LRLKVGNFRKPLWIGLGLIFALGLGLRLHGIIERGYWWDEISLWYEALSDFRRPHIAPIVPWITGFLMRLTRNTGSFVFHLPSVVSGSLAILVTYFIGKRILNRRSGLFAALLVALSPTCIHFSQDGRPYGIFQFTTALLLLAFWYAFERREPRLWILYGLCVFVSALTHLLTVPIVIAHALFIASLYFFKDRIEEDQKHGTEERGEDYLPWIGGKVAKEI